MKKTKEQKGITLIALVITIIVLLILAAISINALSGDNGILSKSRKAKLETSHGAVKDGVLVAYNEYVLELEERLEELSDEYNNRYRYEDAKFNNSNNVNLMKTAESILPEYIENMIYSSTFISYLEYKDYAENLIEYGSDAETLGRDALIHVPNLVGHDTGYGKGTNTDYYCIWEEISPVSRGFGKSNNIYSKMNKINFGNQNYELKKLHAQAIPNYTEIEVEYNWGLVYKDKKGNFEDLYESSDILTIPLVMDDDKISFTIEGKQYFAEPAMTWEVWCDSPYNVDRFYVRELGENWGEALRGKRIAFGDDGLSFVSTAGDASTDVAASDYINANYAYVRDEWPR